MLEVFRAGGLVLDHLAHGVAAAAVAAHGLAGPGLLPRLRPGGVALALPVQQVLDDRREQEPAPRRLQLRLQIRVADRGDLGLQPRHGAPSRPPAACHVVRLSSTGPGRKAPGTTGPQPICHDSAPRSPVTFRSFPGNPRLAPRILHRRVAPGLGGGQRGGRVRPNRRAEFHTPAGRPESACAEFDTPPGRRLVPALPRSNRFCTPNPVRVRAESDAHSPAPRAESDARPRRVRCSFAQSSMRDRVLSHGRIEAFPPTL